MPDLDCLRYPDRMRAILMPTYNFECDGCKETSSIVSTMALYPTVVWCDCGIRMDRVYDSHVSVFKPFKTDVYDGVIREVNTAAERDYLCDKNSCTHDSGRYVRPPIWKPAVDEVSFDDVMCRIKETGGATDELVKDDDPDDIVSTKSLV